MRLYKLKVKGLEVSPKWHPCEMNEANVKIRPKPKGR